MEIKRKNNPQKEDKIRNLQFVLGKVLDVILLIVSVFFLGIGLYALLDSHLVIRKAEIPEDLKKNASMDKKYPSIEELQKINPDIVAWLTLDDTPVDYPITKSTDNTKYLARDYKKFTYTVIRPNAKGRDYAGSLQWIEDAGIIRRCYNTEITELPLEGVDYYIDTLD